VSQSGVSCLGPPSRPDCVNAFASAHARATLDSGILGVFARAFVGDDRVGASGGAVAQITDKMFFVGFGSEFDVVLRVEITGQARGFPLHNKGDFSVFSIPNATASVVSGVARVVLPDTVDVFGPAVLRFRWHVVEPPGDVPASIAFGMALTAAANTGLADTDTEANFANTATLFLELPAGVTYLGSESGLFLTARPDAIIGPGQTEPVAEPSTLALGGAAFVAFAVKSLRRRTRVMRP
jgi:hypothetical protein